MCVLPCGRRGVAGSGRPAGKAPAPEAPHPLCDTKDTPDCWRKKGGRHTAPLPGTVQAPGCGLAAPVFIFRALVVPDARTGKVAPHLLCACAPGSGRSEMPAPQSVQGALRCKVQQDMAGSPKAAPIA
ncbi:hypothetical protein CNY67_01185 [Desulfovibrio sp. G11]|nr:hypothetical protein CNY67_01185 [Desulfovibrio sp. G11]